MPTIITTTDSAGTYDEIGFWSNLGGGVHYSANLNDNVIVTFGSLTPGVPVVLALSWPQNDNAIKNYSWSVLDGTIVLSSGTINQGNLPSSDFSYSGDLYQWIFGQFTPTSTSIKLKMTVTSGVSNYIYALSYKYYLDLAANVVSSVSRQSGDWNTSSIWRPVPPVTQADIKHAVTTSNVNTTITTLNVTCIFDTVDPSAATTASLTIINQIFTLQGNATFGTNTSLTLNDGASLLLDGVVPVLTFGEGTIVTFSGTSSARISVNGKSGSGTPGYFKDAPGTGSAAKLQVSAAYTDFINLGDITNPGIGTIALSFPNGICLFDNCTMTTCGILPVVALGNEGTSSLSLTNNRWTNSVADYDFEADLLEFIGFTGTRLISGNSSTKHPRITNMSGLTITGNVFLDSLYTINSAENWAEFSMNFLRHHNTTYQTFDIKGPMSDIYFFSDGDLINNWHASSYVSSFKSDTLFEGLIFDSLTLTNPLDGGEMILPGNPASPATLTVKNCLTLPSMALKSGQSYRCNLGTLVTVAGSYTNTNLSLVFEHNTHYSTATDAIFDFGEAGYIPTTGEVPSYQANLVWSPLANPGYHISDTGGTFSVTDPVAICDYNAGFNLGVGHGSNPPGYNYQAGSTLPGQHDISGNPQFIELRNLVTWAVSQGSTGSTDAEKVTDALFYLSNDPSLIVSLFSHVRSGYRPTNSIYSNASYPGDSATDASGNPINGTIGAMAYQATATFNLNWITSSIIIGSGVY